MQGDGVKLVIGDFAACGILVVDEVGGDAEAGLGGCGADVVEDRLVASQRLSGPVSTDLAEEAVVDGVPFRGAGGIVTYSDV